MQPCHNETKIDYNRNYATTAAAAAAAAAAAIRCRIAAPLHAVSDVGLSKLPRTWSKDCTDLKALKSDYEKYISVFFSWKN